MADERWLIAGLGNPGPEYSGNRHNAGFMVADLLAERLGARFKRDRSRAAVVAGRLAGFRPSCMATAPTRGTSACPATTFCSRCARPTC